MKSFFAQMYLDLQNRLMDQVPEVEFVEQNFGQYLQENYRDNVAFPAILIDFTTATFTHMQGSNQIGSATINILILFETLSQSYSIAPDEVKEKALGYYEIEAKVNTALQGWQTDYCQPLSRISAKSQNRHDQGVRIREIDYVTEFEEIMPEEKTTTAELAFQFTGTMSGLEEES